MKPPEVESFIMNLIPTLGNFSKSLMKSHAVDDSEIRQNYNQTMRDFNAG